ncbi:MAG TPA: IS1595 family transposase, partial [Bacteroidota bacterium]|nr:IS1595 family transposase [Bacteroidota bacterium]
MKQTANKFTNLLDVANRFPDDKSCREFLEFSRWGTKPVCPHCGSVRKIYRINDGKLFKCADCRKQFTVRVGTIFEDSALPLQKWFMAVYLITAHKKGISSVQLGKDIGVTQKSAWFMLHRIRYAVRTKPSKPLNGIVEADETYVGGKPRKGTLRNPSESGLGNKRGRGTTKTPVFGMVERGGRVSAQAVTNV